MPSFENLRTATDFVAALFWCASVWGMGTAIFRSYPAATLKRWLWSGSDKADAIKAMVWEVRHGREYDPSTSDERLLQQSRELSADEIKARRAQINELSQQTAGPRLLTYLLQCMFCQHVWATAILLLLCGHVAGVADFVASCLGYAGLLALVPAIAAEVVPAAAATRGKSCGGAKPPSKPRG